MGINCGRKVVKTKVERCGAAAGALSQDRGLRVVASVACLYHKAQNPAAPTITADIRTLTLLLPAPPVLGSDATGVGGVDALDWLARTDEVGFTIDEVEVEVELDEVVRLVLDGSWPYMVSVWTYSRVIVTVVEAS